MQITIKPTANTVSADLRKRLKAAANTERALRAAGEAICQLAKRAFNEPSLRPSAWAPLKPATLAEKIRSGKSTAILKRDGVLSKSPRVISVTKQKVTVGSDRPYASVHQRGSKRKTGRGGGIPARPFWPMTPQGKPTERAKKTIEAAIKAVLK